MRRPNLALPMIALSMAACSADASGPADFRAEYAAIGPETPRFNLEVVLRGEGFGLVKFRQPNDNEFVVYLDTWVRDLAPNTSYSLERAVDTTIDGDCTSTAWLTLGQGLNAYPILTDATGTGRAALYRAVPPLAGQPFDIHFRVIRNSDQAEVLASDCYTYTISI